MIDISQLVLIIRDIREDYNYKDSLLEHYTKLAIGAILNYSNMNTDELKNNFLHVVVELAIFYIDNKDNMNIKSESINKSAISYKDSEDIPKHIKSQLPCYCNFF